MKDFHNNHSCAEMEWFSVPKGGHILGMCPIEGFKFWVGQSLWNFILIQFFVGYQNMPSPNVTESLLYHKRNLYA
jgi:hypothetical protein